MDAVLLSGEAGISNVADSDVCADPKSDLLRRIEQSFDPSKRQPPEDIDEARILVEGVLNAVPSYEATRLRTLANTIGLPHEVVCDRVYCALGTAADAFGVWPRTLAAQIVRTKTSVGTLMTQSGKK